MKTIDDFIVVCGNNFELCKITRRSNFEDMNLCETYDKYGNKVTCYDSECYSIDNSECSAKIDMIEDLESHFKIYFDTDEEDSIHFDLNELNKYEFIKGIPIKEIKEFIKDWKNKYEVHTKVMAWTYSDGANFHSFILGNEGIGDYEELSKAQQRMILNEMPDIPNFDEAYTEVETKNFIFRFTKYTNDPWICSVYVK